MPGIQWRKQKKTCSRGSSRTKTVDNLLPEPANVENEDGEIIEEEQIANNTAEAAKYRRKLPRILRTVHFNPEKDSEKYYRELIMLYSPWRDEQNLIGNSNSFQCRFNELEAMISPEMEKYEPYSNIVNLAQEALAIMDDGTEAWDCLAPVTQHEDEIERSLRPPEKDLGIEDGDIAREFGLPVTDVENELIKYNELPDEEYRKHMRFLNEEQLEFLYDTMYKLKTSSTPIYRFMSGGAGVGKSFLTKAIYQTMLKYLNKKAGEDFTTRNILLIAPTGKAAYHIQGNTIHSALKILPNQSLAYKPLSSSSLNTLRQQIGNLQMIFMDEVSMVGFRMLNCINQRLMEVMQCNKPFGGISLIAVGDLFQLKPVRDSYIFSTPRSDYLPLAMNIWTDLFKMFELKKIMRQADSRLFAELLNRLREGNQTDEDINVLKQRLTDRGSPEYPQTVCHLFATNESVNMFNSSVISTSSNAVYTIHAKDRVVGSTSPEMTRKIIESFTNSKEKNSQLPNILQVAKDIYVELTVNVDTTDGLINGASCKIKIIDIVERESQASGVIWVEFDATLTGAKLRTDSRRLYRSCHQKQWTPIQPVLKQYAAGHKGQAQLQRFQFPLRAAHAKTIHRSQGDTLSTVVVDLTTIRKVDHMHYVALSRCQSLDNLFILNLQEDKISVDKSVREEMERLRSMPIEMDLKFLYNIPQSHKITFLNARSLHRHMEDVREDHNIHAVDIACFCETRFSHKDTLESTTLGNFDQYRKDCLDGNCQRSPYGTALYMRYPVNIIEFHESFQGIELLVFQSELIENITFVMLYKHPKTPVERLCAALRTISTEYINTTYSIIMGDFNVNWANHSSEKAALQTLLVENLHYEQQIITITNDHGSTIDLVFSNVPSDRSPQYGVMEVYYSDHKIVWFACN